MLKTKIFRNRKLLDLAKKAPQCFLCECPNDETVIMAHSNQYRDGHGKGLKSSDAAIAALCSVCHFSIDSGKDWTRMQKIEAWEKAHRATMRWLIESEHLIVK